VQRSLVFVLVAVAENVATKLVLFLLLAVAFLALLDLECSVRTVARPAGRRAGSYFRRLLLGQRLLFRFLDELLPFLLLRARAPQKFVHGRPKHLVRQQFLRRHVAHVAQRTRQLALDQRAAQAFITGRLGSKRHNKQQLVFTNHCTSNLNAFLPLGSTG
jgi:hypothetical protein